MFFAVHFTQGHSTNIQPLPSDSCTTFQCSINPRM